MCTEGENKDFNMKEDLKHFCCASCGLRSITYPRLRSA